MNNIPKRAEYWQLKTQILRFGQLPAIMGIVNVTPDSFSDGGQFFSPQAAIDQALQLVEQGADILDIGGESTRPYSTPVDAVEELRRVLPVIEAVCRQTEIPVSIDTSKALVAHAAIAAGAQIINDVTGLEKDPQMIEVALQSRAGVCAMHMQGSPQTMQDNPTYRNVVEEIYEYLLRRKKWLLGAGIDGQRICLDPGIGFGKTHEHNIELVRNCRRFLDLETPILVGHSRKGFIAKIIGDKDADRTAATLGISVALALAGVQILRVHDVQATCHALRTFAAARNIEAAEIAVNDES